MVQALNGQENNVRIEECVDDLSEFIGEVVSRMGCETIIEADDEMFALYAYVFGAISAMALKRGFTAKDAHAVAITLFVDSFLLSTEDALAICERCMAAMDKAHPLNFMLNVGLDDYLSWRTDNPSFGFACAMRELARAK